MRKVVTVGEILVEVMATVPGHGFLEPMALVGPFPSGAPAIFIDQVGRLGQPCDLFLPSGPELRLFAEARDDADAVAEILTRGVGAVVVKRGAGGADHHDASGALHQPAFAVEEVDPTGAGDCFGAAFVVFWLRGLPPAAALRYAAAAGARAVTRRGPMEGASTTAELDALIASAGSRAP